LFLTDFDPIELEFVSKYLSHIVVHQFSNANLKPVCANNLPLYDNCSPFQFL